MNNKVKAFQMAIGCDLIGSKMSMASSKNLSLELTTVGVKAYSQGSNRTIIIPFANVKGIEMFPETNEVIDEDAPSTDLQTPKRGRPKLN